MARVLRQRKCKDELSKVSKQEETVQDSKRKSLQTLQKSASDENILVGLGGVVQQKKKRGRKPKPKDEVPKVEIVKSFVEDEKENNYVASKPSRQKCIDTTKSDKVEKTVLQSKNKASSRKKKTDVGVVNDENLNNIGDSETKSETDHDSALSNKEYLIISEAKSEIIKTSIPGSVSNQIQFWKEIAHEKQIELQKALEKNESLHEQWEVLNTDNAELSSILDKADELVNYLDNIDNPSQKCEDSSIEVSAASIVQKSRSKLNFTPLRHIEQNSVVSSSDQIKSKDIVSKSEKQKGGRSSKNSKAKVSKKTSAKKKAGLSAPSEISEANFENNLRSDNFSSQSKMSDEIYYSLMCDTESEIYWKFVAEQKLETLETVLQENELVQDQLIELEAESVKLNSLLGKAKELAEFVYKIVA